MIDVAYQEKQDLRNIESKINNLQKAADELDAYAANLVSRLEPVMLPSLVDGNKVSSGDVPKNVQSPLANRIEAATDRIFMAQSKLRTIMDCLEI